MRLKLLQKKQFKKRAEATGDLNGYKLLIGLQKFQKIHNKLITNEHDQKNQKNTKKSQKFQNIHSKIIQRQLQMRMIKKDIKKEIYIQKKDKKLLIILILI